MFQNYESTRDIKLKSSASEAVLKGIANDGGLYVMRNLDDKKVDIKDLTGKSYTEIAEIILSLMLDDFNEAQIKNCVDKAYTNKFSKQEITPVVKVGKDYVTELFHGPTSAFKDVALSILPHLITTSYQMNDVKGEVIILTATSGDTGKAALEGFKDVNGTKIMVFYPEGGVSEVQKSQMVTQEGKNTFVCAIRGNFDDAQTGVKNIFGDEHFNKELQSQNKMFSSANSINVGRLVPQIVYYFYSYMDLFDKKAIHLGDKINFAVPTGNFGNILAGFYAKLLGLPINNLICASNENNVLYDFIKTGVYDRNRQFYKTVSPSMDILVSSNLERLLYFISGKDNGTVKDLMNDLNTKGKYVLNENMKKQIEEEFYADCVYKEDTFQTIKEVFYEHKYLLDTHTAVAYKALQNYQAKTGDDTVSVVLSTASPYKFTSSVYEALYGKSDKNEFELMKELSEKTGVEIPDNLLGLQNKPVLHTAVCDKDKMDEFVKSNL